MLGIATLRIELSTTMTSRLTLRTSRISQRRLYALAATCSRMRDGAVRVSPDAAAIASSARSRAACDAVDQRQAHVRRGDPALRVQHGLEHRRVGLGEARLHHREQRFVVRAPLLDLPGERRTRTWRRTARCTRAPTRRSPRRRRGSVDGEEVRRRRRRAPRSRSARRRAARAWQGRPRRRTCFTPAMFGVLASSSIPAVSSTRPVRTGML